MTIAARTCSPAWLLVFVAMVLTPLGAQAIPAFARKTGLSCSACHEAWPRLNEFGQQFRDNGYRLRRGKDAPTEQSPFYWPITFRTTTGYQWLRQTLQPADNHDPTMPAGTVTTQTGTFGFTGLDIHTAGTLGDKISFFITYTPGLKSSGFGLAPSDGNLESAWAGFHEIFGTTWLNVRVGKHALDLPEDEHRTLTLTQGYTSYHYHPAGSAVTFEHGNNQVGLELFGHDDLSRLRYSVSLVNANGAPLGNTFISSPLVWGHLQGRLHFNNDLLAGAKLGVFGALGWQPTAFETLTPTGGVPSPLVGSGFAHVPYRRLGGEAHLYFLSDIYPLTLTGVMTYGSEDQALISGVAPDGTAVSATSDASFIGWWAELSYTPMVNLVVLARAERLRVNNQGVATNPPNLSRLTTFTGALRYTMELTNRTEVALHLEVSSSTKVVDASGNDPNVLTGLAGIDFAF